MGCSCTTLALLPVALRQLQMPTGCCSLHGPLADFQLIGRFGPPNLRRRSSDVCVHIIHKNACIHTPWQCARQSSSLSSLKQTLPAVPGVSPPAASPVPPRGTAGDRGAHGGLRAIHQHSRVSRPGRRAAASPRG